MTTITQDMTDIAGVDDNTSWTFYTKELRLSDTGDAIVTTKKVRKYPVAGVLTVELDPGPAAVTAVDGKSYRFTVPETDSDLWSLLAGAIGMPPGTTQAAIAAAVADYMAAHPGSGSEYDEYANLAAFPGTGEADRIYVALDTGKFYRWNGSAYAQIAGNAATALQLFTARNINGVAFNGTADITVADATKQPLDTDLTALAALVSAANKVPYATGAGTWALADFTAAGRALVDDADAAAQRATLSAAKRTTYLIDDYGTVDYTGATSSATAIAAAKAAMGSNPGVLVIGPGIVDSGTAGLGTFQQGQSCVGAGRGATLIKYSGTGDCVDARDTRAFIDPPHYLPGSTGGAGFGGQIGPFTVDGTGAGSAACGLHIGDMVHATVDVSVVNFIGATAKGVWLDNQTTWTERSRFYLGVENCTKCVLVDVNGGFDSFLYNTFEIWTNAYANQNAVELTNGADVEGCNIKWSGACFAGTAASLSGATANTGVALSVGADSSAAKIRNSRLDINVECQAYNVANASHKTIVVGASAAAYPANSGRLIFTNGGADWAAGSFGNRISFDGPMAAAGDANIGGMDQQQAARTLGLVTGCEGYLDPGGDLYLGSGNWFAAQMNSGTVTINPIINAAVGWPQAAQFDLFLQQPASGSTTFTWPGSWVWLGGTMVPSAVNNAVDHVRLTVDFGGGVTYAQHVNRAVQTHDGDLDTIAGLTATTDNFLQAKASAWASRTPTQVTADLIGFVGDSGSGGTKGLVPAPVTGDATKFLKGNGTWTAIPGGGDALVANPLSQFAATTSAQLAGVLSDETGSGAAVFGTTPTLATPVINGTPTGTGVGAGATASVVALRDANAQLLANSFVAGFTTTATAAGTTTLTIAATPIQVFTGATTQTVKLPTTSVAAGQQYLVVNQSTGAVTVQSSGANTITILAAGTAAWFTAVVATPTTAANWDSRYFGVLIASGKSLSVSNTLTLAGTDGTTMTFPGASDTVAGLAAVQTITGAWSFNDGKLILNGATSGSTTLKAAATASGTLTLPAATDTLVGRNTTDTLTLKRITKRVVTTNAPGATPTINLDNGNQFNFTGINAAITSLTSSMSGTATDGESFIFRFKDDGTARAITAGANFRAIGVTLSTTTVISKTLYWGCIWNAADSKLDVLAIGQEA